MLKHLVSLPRREFKAKIKTFEFMKSKKSPKKPKIQTNFSKRLTTSLSTGDLLLRTEQRTIKKSYIPPKPVWGHVGSEKKKKKEVIRVIRVIKYKATTGLEAVRVIISAVGGLWPYFNKLKLNIFSIV